MNPFVADHLKNVLKDKKILLGISGSIAAFKACELVRLLRVCGAQVRVVLTESAERFVTPTTLEVLSGAPVLTRLWKLEGNPEGASENQQGNHHIDAARWADLLLIAPATAHTLARLAQGLADDLLTTEYLAFRGPVIVAPAMNPSMFEHPAVQANLRLLRERGVLFAGPAYGVTSCGEEGLGRMLEPEALLEKIAQAFYAPPNGKQLLITLGPTRSAIDPVRYVTNRSSGLMGAALCWAAVRQGYRVTAVVGPTDASLPSDITVHAVQTAREMLAQAEAVFPKCDVFIASAAVLDWDVKNFSERKLKKGEGALSLEFEQNPDILATLGGRKKPGQFVLGFAAETRHVVQAGIQKRLAKHCDALFANDVSLSSQGFEAHANGGWWISAQEIFEFTVRPKTQLAALLIGLIEGKTPMGIPNLLPATTKLPAGSPEPHPFTRPDDARIS